jgi:hypothetical protein
MSFTFWIFKELLVKFLAMCGDTCYYKLVIRKFSGNGTHYLSTFVKSPAERLPGKSAISGLSDSWFALRNSELDNIFFIVVQSIKQWMPYKADLNVVFVIKIFLKWQDHQHKINIPFDLFYPRFVPCPNLWRNVIDGTYVYFALQIVQSGD